MTVAWIATRRILAVVEQHEPYATRCGHWRASTVSGQVKSGWIWEHCDRPTLSRMMLGEAFNENELESEFLTIRQSRIELWSELKTGNIKATGKLGNNERTAIDAHLWQDLQLGSSGKKRDYVHPTNNLNPNSVWNHVTFSRDAVMKRFPANPADFQQADLKAVGTVVSSSKMPKLEIAKLAISTLWPDSVPTTN